MGIHNVMDWRVPLLLKWIGAGAIVAVVVIASFLLDYGKVVKEFEITRGNVDRFIIGETKESLLGRLPDEAYSPNPKPIDCPANWIEVKAMNDVQRQCLLGANQWEVGDGWRGLCPENTNFFAPLVFESNKLQKVQIRCTRPE